MRPGIAFSAAAHALLIGVAVWALPWLRARPEPASPVIRVSLVSPAELAALTPPPPPAAERPPPLVLEAPPVVVAPAPLPEELPLPEEPVPDSLAPAFDPEAPLGIATGDDDGAPAGEAAVALSGPAEPSVLAPLAPVERILQPDPASPAGEPPPTQLLRSTPPMPRPGDAAAAAVPAAPEAPAVATAPASDPAGVAQMVLQAAVQAAVQAAIAAAQDYPQAERDAGVTGTTRIEVSVARDGRLLQARLAESSGSEALDRATLTAARQARLPAAPAGLAGESFRFEVGLSYPPAAP